jgi:hypothetical protein
MSALILRFRSQPCRAKNTIVTCETIRAVSTSEQPLQALEGQELIALRAPVKSARTFLYMLEMDPLQRGGRDA